MAESTDSVDHEFIREYFNSVENTYDGTGDCFYVHRFIYNICNRTQHNRNYINKYINGDEDFGRENSRRLISP